MQRLGELTDQQTPLLSDLQRAAPSLTEFFTRLGPFSDASRPAFRSPGPGGRRSRRAFAHSAQEIAELRALAKDAPGLAKPLRQLLQSAGDSKMHVDADLRGPRSPRRRTPTATPTPRTAASARGFTAGVAPQLRLLADPGAQRVRRHQPHAPGRGVPDPGLLEHTERPARPDMNKDPSQHAYALKQGSGAQEVQLVPRPVPAWDHQP